MATEMDNRKLPTAAWETVTPAIARQVLEHNAVNRPLSRATVAYYAMQMKRGQWRMNGETVSISDQGNLMNGQHRLNAVILAGTAVAFLVVRGVDEATFPSFDGGKNRSVSDVLNLAQVKNATHISSMLQKRQSLLLGQQMVGGSRGAARGNVQARKLSRQDYLDVYESAPALFTEISNKGQSLYARLRLFSRSEVSAVMCYLHIDRGHALAKVYGFFDALFGDGDHECKSIGLLRASILRDIAATRSMTGEYKFQLLVKAWNDYAAGFNGRKQLRWSKENEGRLTFK